MLTEESRYKTDDFPLPEKLKSVDKTTFFYFLLCNFLRVQPVDKNSLIGSVLVSHFVSAFSVLKVVYLGQQWRCKTYEEK